jgi:hypothetical protein
MNRLDDAMNRLAQELAETDAPPEIESTVLAEFDRVAQMQARRRRRGRYWIAAAGAIAASTAGLWMIVKNVQHKPAPPPSVQTEAEQPFVPIPYVLPPAPYERVEVVRMKLPVAALIAAGFQMQTADLGAQAEADVIVGQDGRARAVRLISISSLN